MFDASLSDPRPVSAAPSRSHGGFLDPALLAGALWSARVFLILMALLGLGLATAIALSTPKQYTAAARLVLDPRDLNLVQNEVTVTPAGMTTDATIALVESQIAVMTSNSVLERVVDEAGLTQDPEFSGQRSGPLSALTAGFAALFSSDPEAVMRDRQLVTIAELRDRLAAYRDPNSFVIDVSVRSEDPEKAARLANLVTQVFVAEQGRAQAETARRATQALTSRLAELRQRVVEAESAVETYKADNQLVGVGGRLIDDEYITRINNQLAETRAQITTLAVRAESLRRASVADVVEGSFPEGLNSEALLRLRQTYSEAAQNQALLSSRLGPRHPQRIASEQALATARRAIETELSRIVASAQTELARARETERDLTGQIDKLRTRQIETSGAFVRLRELEREVDASRAVYEAFLLRARQTGEQETLNTANVRVISPATVPFHPSSLSRRILAIGGLVGGFGVGVGLVVAAFIVRRLRGLESDAAPQTQAQTFAPAPTPSFDREPAQTVREVLERDRRMTDRMPGPARESGQPVVEPPPATEAVSPALDADGWSLRGGDHDDMEPGETSDTLSEDELERRREGLRERIRAIGARRQAASDRANADADAATDTRERVSLRLEAARRRAATAAQENSGT